MQTGAWTVALIHGLGRQTKEGLMSRRSGNSDSVENLHNHKDESDRLQSRFELERLIASTTACFVSALAEDVDEEINLALGKIGGFSQVDRSYIFLFKDECTKMDNTHEWCADGIEPQIGELQDVPVEIAPWWVEQLRRHEHIHIPRVSDLPPEAASEKKVFEDLKIKSLIGVPMVLRGNLVGFIGFDSVHTEKTWDSEIVSLLEIVGEIFAHALERKKTKEALKESEERYRTLAENVSVGIYRNTPGSRGRFIEANTALVRMFGFERKEELLNINVADLYRNPKDREKFSKKMLENGYVKNEEIALKKKDDTPIWCSVTAVAVTDEDGNVKHYDGVIEDITERRESQRALEESRQLLEQRVAERTSDLERANLRLKQELEEREKAEAGLRDAEEKFRAMTASAQDAITMIDDNGDIIYWNQAAEIMFGYTTEEVLGKELHVLLAPGRFHDSYKAGFEEFRTSGNGIAVGHTLEISAIRKDGEEFPMELSLSALRVKGKWNAIGIIRDITERKKAAEALQKANEELEDRVAERTAELREANERLELELAERRRVQEALRAGEERYRRFFEEDLTGDYISSPDGKLLACNPAFARILGFDNPEDVMSHQAVEFYSSNQAREDFLDLVKREKKLTNYETQYCKRDGSTVYVIENAVGTFDNDGELTEIKGYIFDNTERKKLEGQLLQSQKMEAIGRLAGGVAHDFNNMLTAIMGYSDILISRLPAGDPLLKNVIEIKKAGEQASLLTQQLLAFSRKQVLRPQVLELNTVIRETDDMLRRLIGDDIELLSVLSSDLWPLRADQSQLKQIILNLAINSRDAMPDGGRLVVETRNVELDEEYCRIHSEVSEGQYVMLSVTDTGIGMDAETCSHIFEPFFTTKEQGKGTGLGLSTVYGIVQQSKGHVTVYSEQGKGTAFKIYLPCVVESAQKVVSAESSPGLPGGSETVLVVEDEDSVRNLARSVLEAKGYSVLEASGGQEALRIAREYEGTIDILLTDVMMPRMSGSDLARRMAAERPGLKVVFVSGYSESFVLQNRVLDPDSVFLEKPFTPNSLTRKIRQALKAA
jgi:PAS domain S-box-containing protein